MIGSPLHRRFLMVAGKGGVGRTTVAAAMARAAQRSGRRVLLAQMDSPERLQRLLGAPRPIGPEVVDLGDGLHAVNMTPRTALHEYGLMVLRSELVYKTLFENRAVRGFLDAVPGLDAYAMLGKAWWHTHEAVAGQPKYDLVIVDGPASGHAVRVLTIPQAILDAVPKGPLARDAALMKTLFSDPARSAFVVVTLPEDLPARETSVLARQVKDLLQMPLAPLVVNGVPSATFAAPALQRLLEAPWGSHAGDPALASTLEGARLLRDRRVDAEAILERLATDPGLPILELPRLPTSDLGPAETAALADVIHAAWA